ncbi:MAG TPA: tetratricopeptide repeat protein [Lacunisphaera sp.]|nr:tetratricopeptide repeat protein [Lacunisphaera sp.]
MSRAMRQNQSSRTGFITLPATLWLALFVIAALAAYWPALRGDFLWDDAGHVTNPALQSWPGLLRIWLEPGTTQQYYPLLHSAFWLEHKLWGDAALGYHVVNIIQHAVAATLFGLLLRRLAVPGAWLAASLFLLHPVCAESVAWISEQKNTLSLVFYLGAALAYLRFDAERCARRYVLATVLFACALLTKSVTASLPAALLVVFWWQRGRLDWRRDTLPLLPWFVLGAGCGLFTAHFERVLIGAQGSDFTLGALDRLVLSGRIFWFYLGKLAWPADLSFVYPRWNVDAAVWWQWLFPAAGLALVAGLVKLARRTRAPLAAALLFGGSLFPVLGFVNVYPFVFSYVADHFQYLASLGVFACAGATLTRLPDKLPALAAAILAMLLGFLTWRHAAIFRNDVTLYEDTLRQNPDAWLAHHNLATILIDAGQLAEALSHIERTLAIRPAYPEALCKLGDCLTRLGRAGEAVPPLERAIQLQPNFAEAHNNLGVTFMALNRVDEGRARFEAAVKLNPDYATAHRNLGLALAQAKHLAEAATHFACAAELDPTDVVSRLQLGTALAMQGRYADALPHFQAALELDPGSAQAHFRLAATLNSLGRIAEAKTHYLEAIRLDPRLAK